MATCQDSELESGLLEAPEFGPFDEADTILQNISSLGGEGGNEPIVCLSSALNALGARVPTRASGALRALEHGNRWLSDLGLKLIRQPYGPTRPGRYIKWEAPQREAERAARVGHFVAVILRPGRAMVIDYGAKRRAVREWQSWGDIPNVEEHKWFLLVELSAQSPEPESDHILAWGTTKHKVESHALDALLSRRASREQASPYATALHSSVSASHEVAQSSSNRHAAMRLSPSHLLLPLPPADWPETRAPDVPCDFSLELPRLPKIRLLERLNSHSRDCQLHFVEETHSYYIRGKRTQTSVTGLIREYSQPFDAPTVIAKMRTGRNWPRPEYLRYPRPQDVVSELRDKPEATRLHALLVSSKACDFEICFELKRVVMESPRLANLLGRLSLSDYEIIEKWRINKEEAARRGTWMHWTFEAHLNQVSVHKESKEFQLFSKFLSTLRGLTAFRTEWAIFAEHEGLAGSIDFVTRDEYGNMHIYDWKRTKNLRRKFTNLWDSMTYPLDNLSDCQGNHYRVQLNIYKWMLERYYGVRVAAMSVVCLHPDNGDQPFVDVVPIIPEIDELMHIQRTRFRELEAMASEDVPEMDPVGGRWLDL